MAIIEQNPAEERPFGTFAPKAYLARIIARTRAASDSFLGRKVAYALRRLGLRALDGAPVDIESLGAKMRLYPDGNVCEKRVLFTPQYFDAVERELLASRLRDGFTFIDIGANIGAYSLFVAARAGRGARILAVEPQPEIFARLSFNIAQNPFGTVKAVACALADKPGELTLFIDPTNRGESSVRILNSSAGTSVKVPAMTLLSLVEGEGYERIDAIKLDVEGAEDLILEPFLRDAPQTLWPGFIIIEDSRQRWQSDLAGLLERSGYMLVAQTRLNLVFERKQG
ncbi:MULTISPECIES: FkbM family methyltransferase [Bosea]|uniref:FkbM family methyltransferase n=1 Tax=Bosea TaxID=85413 RepID=UPI00214FE29D|nr:MULTISPECIES: FkbM family methyltransferase [Bosea]MCR4521038.1 FkbM family methyltransferase [Bosea sp. 47.2.35]MDR6830683.1 FkbM family methyltransferase [Bosea robiniae]MDR6897564.1 FkbM family methyltransferase [Bosea sp. BE109]MDR7140961.1 FkbM family methyltransferase [Bosea sp. BE168]MDR7177519.1 FkbM family methyltransferase [Bosea sp. BE271]